MAGHQLQGSLPICGNRDETGIVAEARARNAAGGLEGRGGQPRPGLRQVGAKGKTLGLAADAGQGPVCFSGMDHEEQVICARLFDGRAEGHAHREFEDPAFSGGGVGLHDDSLDPQLGGLSCNRRLDEGTSGGQRMLERPIIGPGL